MASSQTGCPCLETQAARLMWMPLRRSSRCPAVALAPLIHEQDEFAKNMGEKHKIGGDLSKAIADTELDKHNSLVHVRDALITTNLTAPKVEGSQYQVAAEE